MKLNITTVSDQLFEFLLDHREKDNGLRFSLRKSNYGGKLEEGYWFNGDENFLAISFWSGMDWNSRLPNISWIIDNRGYSWLEINVSDSDIKIEFVNEILAPELGLTRKRGSTFFKEYGYGDEPISQLREFLSSDRYKIDSAIENRGRSFFEEKLGDNPFTAISSEEFESRLSNVKYYRDELANYPTSNLGNTSNISLPTKLESLTIRNYGAINEISLNVSSENQWIFITGENGSGKTQILRAIATLLGNKSVHSRNSEFEAYYTISGEEPAYRYFDQINKVNNPVVRGLAAYGPFRLDISNRIGKISFYKKLESENQLDSLFKNNVRLLSLDKQISIWKSGSSEDQLLLDQRLDYIKAVLPEIIPGLTNLGIEGDSLRPIIRYYFRDEDSSREYSRSWNQLSSGNRSMLAMIGDILIRLYHQQQQIMDPSELAGVVIIDEIDLHLHPKAQRELIIKLSETFRKVQFIVSTHSPIPFLGAPRESKFYIAIKDEESHSKIEELVFDNVMALTPNLLLTSPVFGFSEIFNEKIASKLELRTEDTWTEMIERDDLDKGLISLYKQTLDKLDNNERS